MARSLQSTLACNPTTVQSVRKSPAIFPSLNSSCTLPPKPLVRNQLKRTKLISPFFWNIALYHLVFVDYNERAWSLGIKVVQCIHYKSGCTYCDFMKYQRQTRWLARFNNNNNNNKKVLRPTTSTCISLDLLWFQTNHFQYCTYMPRFVLCYRAHYRYFTLHSVTLTKVLLMFIHTEYIFTLYVNITDQCMCTQMHLCICTPQWKPLHPHHSWCGLIFNGQVQKTQKYKGLSEA